MNKNILLAPLKAAERLLNRLPDRIAFGPKVDRDELPMQSVFTFLTGRDLATADTQNNIQQTFINTAAKLPHNHGQPVAAGMYFSWPRNNDGTFIAKLMETSELTDNRARATIRIMGLVSPDGSIRGFIQSSDDSKKQPLTEAGLAQFARCRAAINPTRPVF